MAASPNRLRIAVLFGGRSAEHDVSVLSATNVMRALEPAKYDAVPVFVTREGQWLLSSFEGGTLAKPSSGTQVCLVPGGQGRMMAIPTDGAPYELPKIEILFPVLHGLHGEDGAVQGRGGGARTAGRLRHSRFRGRARQGHCQTPAERGGTACCAGRHDPPGLSTGLREAAGHAQDSALHQAGAARLFRRCQQGLDRGGI